MILLIMEKILIQLNFSMETAYSKINEMKMLTYQDRSKEDIVILKTELNLGWL